MIVRKVRRQVKKELGHGEFCLRYRGRGKWDIYSLKRELLGFVFDRWPFYVCLQAKESEQ